MTNKKTKKNLFRAKKIATTKIKKLILRIKKIRSCRKMRVPFRFVAISMLMIFAIIILAPKTLAANKNESLIFSEDYEVTGYYSPIENQKHYLKGSIEAEKILNGNGIVGADNTPVFLGMIAAPRGIPFGTKVYIPSIGLGEVHDRGGAIKNKRLDVWMGKGDEGLSRAIAWGKRTKRVTFYLPGAEIPPAILARALDGSYLFSKQTVSEARIAQLQRYNGVQTTAFSNFKTLKIGMKSDLVKTMQKNLGFIGAYNGPATGYFGNQTKSAIVKFQLDNKVISSENHVSAGFFGPLTFTKMTEIMSAKNITPADKNNPEPKQFDVIALSDSQSTNPNVNKKSIADSIKNTFSIQTAFAGYEKPDNNSSSFAENLTLGDRGAEVEKLHEMLSWLGFGEKEKGTYYSLQTAANVFLFQKENNIVESQNATGAGVLGPKTRKVLEEAISEKKKEKVELSTKYAVHKK